jgi:hypothetical protein
VTPSGEILPVDTRIVGDLKTSKSLEYSKGAFASQMSLYAQGQFYDVETDEFTETPDINQDWGIIAWIPSDRMEGHCEMIWLDLQAGNEAAYLASQVKEYRKKWRQTDLVTVADPAKPVAVILEEELGAEPIDMIGFIKARISAIRDNPDALNYLMTWWPDGVPSPKKGLPDPDDIEKVLDLLDKTEAQFGLDFPADDPRANPGAHKSAGPVKNKETS